MKTAIPRPSKQSIIREARDYVMIAIGMILYGIGWTVFLLPNDITTGGVPGIASIVYWATGFPVQYTYFSINFFLLLLALKLLGMKFCIKSIYPHLLSVCHPKADNRVRSSSRPALYGMCHRSILLWRWYRNCFFG
jgi:uncharacterized membrane-anchored protein YitT (DUF2179 family)